MREITLRVPKDAVINIAGLEDAIRQQHEANVRVQIMEQLRSVPVAKLKAFRDMTVGTDEERAQKPTQPNPQQPTQEASRRSVEQQ